MLRQDMVVGREYEVVANTSSHGFALGEIVRFREDDGDEDLNLICAYRDGSDYWFLNAEDLEEV